MSVAAKPETIRGQATSADIQAGNIINYSNTGNILEQILREPRILNMGTSDLPGLIYHTSVLSEDRRETRLLHILPAEHEGAPIHCTLSTAYLDDDGLATTDGTGDHGLQYEALSYAWGTLYHQDPIYIEGHPKFVTERLYQALESLRYDTHERLMWIDALCIDQSNLMERSHQVGMVSSIYSNASNTTVWLGVSSADAALAMNFLERMGHNHELHLDPALTPHVEVEAETLSSTRIVAGLKRLFCDPWWSRVWTLQEYVLSKHTTFRCGTSLLDGQVLQQALWVWYRHTNLHLCCSNFTMNHADWQDLHLCQGRLADIVYVRAYFDTLHLPQIIGRFLTRLVTDPRDKIYGMLGLARRDYEKAVTPDYSLSAEEVFESATVQMIRQTESLDVLSSQPPNSPSLLNLPSWVPDWTASYGIDLRHSAFKDWICYLHMYDACKNAVADVKVPSPGSIHLEGITVDEIKVCANFDWNLMLLEVLKMVANMYESATKAGEVKSCVSDFWATMCGSITRCHSDNGDVLARQSTDQDRLSSLFTKLTLWKEKPVHDMLQESSEDAEIASFVHVLACISTGRQFTITKSGRLAWCPGPCKEGDIIAVLAGGRVPFVIRLAEDSRYRFLGDAYVHGIMDGEAVEEMYAAGKEWGRITLF